jgi:uroporphyrinogen III methyltransferase/synthase
MGRTVVITRPGDRADEMIAAIVRLGGEPLVCPMIEVKRLPEAAEHRELLDKLDQFDWLLFTSTAAVEAFKSWLDNAAINTLPGFLRIIVVGQKTAAAVHEQGWRVEAFADHPSAAGVVTTLLRHRVGPDSKILFPRALEGNETIPQELIKAGAELVLLPVYHTLPMIPANLEELRTRLRHEKIDAITFTSPSAVRHCFLWQNGLFCSRFVWQ